MYSKCLNVSITHVVSVEALRNTNVKLYPGLLDRLIRAGLCVPLFTEKQKLILLNVAVSLIDRSTRNVLKN
jgi:hypothetical protein